MCAPVKIFSFLSALALLLISPSAFPQSEILQRLNAVESRLRRMEAVDQTIAANDQKILKQINSIRIRVRKGPGRPQQD